MFITQININSIFIYRENHRIRRNRQKERNGLISILESIANYLFLKNMNSRKSKICDPLKRNSHMLNAHHFKINQLVSELFITSFQAQTLVSKFQSIAEKNIDITYLNFINRIKKQPLSIYLSEIQQFLSEFKQKKIDLFIFSKIYFQLKKKQEQLKNSDGEILNAFVALGGNQDRTGTVEKRIIIDIIKEQFQLTFNIQQLLQKIGNVSIRLTYQQFRQIFNSVNQSEKNIMSRSIISSADTTRQQQEQEPFKIKYTDFQKWFQLNKI